MEIFTSIKVKQDKFLRREVGYKVTQLLQHKGASTTIVRTEYKGMGEGVNRVLDKKTLGVRVDIGHLESEESGLSGQLVMDHSPNEGEMLRGQASGGGHRPGSHPINLGISVFNLTKDRFSS